MSALKLLVKKIFCPRCRELVKGQEQKVNNTIRVLCSKCQGLICYWDGLTWRYT